MITTKQSWRGGEALIMIFISTKISTWEDSHVPQWWLLVLLVPTTKWSIAIREYHAKWTSHDTLSLHTMQSLSHCLVLSLDAEHHIRSHYQLSWCLCLDTTKKHSPPTSHAHHFNIKFHHWFDILHARITYLKLRYIFLHDHWDEWMGLNNTQLNPRNGLCCKWADCMILVGSCSQKNMYLKRKSN